MAVAKTREKRSKPRTALSRDRILRAALGQADTGGLEALTIRGLAGALGAAPMALYRHVSNKDDLVDGLVDLVFAEIELPPNGEGWKSAMRQRAISLRDALSRHRWAVGLMESRRNPGPANLRHHDAVLRSLRQGGFSIGMAAHAYSVLDGYIYGFALTKMNLPFQSSDEMAAVAKTMLKPFPINEYPNLVEMLTKHVMRPGYDYGEEFEYGLDLILDGLEKIRGRAR